MTAVRLGYVLGLFVGICVNASAQDPGVPDTIYYGESGVAYGTSTGQFRVPVYVTSDQELRGVQFGVEFGVPPYVDPTFDSLSDRGTIFEDGDYFEIGHLLLNDSGVDGVAPDTICIGGAAIVNNLPPGSYKYCDIWFSGADVGDQVELDTAWAEPACELTFAAADYYNYTPQFVGGVLTIVPDTVMYIYAPDSVDVNAADVVSFDVSAVAYATPLTITFDGLENAGGTRTPIHEPITYGTNPLTFEWETAAYEGGSDWVANFTITDDNMATTSVSVFIRVLAHGPYYGLIGDTNCDGTIDIDDVVFLLTYMFSGGAPPRCD